METYYEKQVIASHQDPEARDYWLKKLSGDIQKSHFPYDYKDIGRQTERNWDNVKIEFHQELSSKLIKVSKGSDRALHIVLAAGIAFLLAKYDYKCNKDIIFGSPVYKQGAEGEFINVLLPLRIQIKENPTFKDWLLQMKQTVVEAVKHQNYPVIVFSWELDFPIQSFSQLMEADFPLFDVLVLLENIHEQRYLQYFRFNTIFHFTRTGETITGKLKYNPQRYEKTTIKQIAGHFTVLMEKVLFNARLELSGIEILGQVEKEQLLDEFNRGSSDYIKEYPGNKTLHELFVEQVEQTPDGVAVKGPVPGTANAAMDTEIAAVTYKELNRKTNQLARLLKNKGVKADTIVAISVERSVEMIIGIMAILKAGGAYLPMEPGCPDDRLDYMMADSSAALMLTTRHLSELGEMYRKKKLDARKIFIEEKLEKEKIVPSPTLNQVNPANLAYVIYTSGTSGRPKSVLIKHSGVANYVHWKLKAYGINARDITLQLLSYAFDAFGCNFYPALFSGGVLVIVPETKKLDYDYIKKILNEQQVTNLGLVPGMYDALLSRAEADELQSLRFVVLGGEKPGANLIEKSKKKNPGLCHIIEYGPTEASIGAAANIGISPRETAVIGKPIANTRIYIVDHFLHPQPKGVPGELCITGTGVARGYLNHPELTEKKFCLRRPGGTLFGKNRPRETSGTPPQKLLFEKTPGKKIYRSFRSHLSYIYRTGDLARWLPDRNIEFLGRIDQQVKIRGFRVELGEIENLLRSIKGIDQCIVITRETGESNQLELIAYYQTNNNIPSSDIREFLAHQLPDYMIPSRLIKLEEFPLTPNGKIDRNALASPGKFEAETGLVKPHNEIEKRVLEVFKQVIGAEEIGINNGFFDIGGTSLKAIFAVTQLSKELDITVEQLYQYRTIEEIAKNITWKKDTLEARIKEIKMGLIGAPSTANQEFEARSKQIEQDYNAYIQQVEKEDLPDLAAEHHYGHIFLTGGTGYLGAHLIDEILKTTNAELHLLVRGDSYGEAKERLKKKLGFYFGENFFETNKNRLHVVYGDIRGEEFGIDDSLYEELAEKVDAVVHSAADARDFGMYDDLYKVNVLGTENLLKLAEKGKKKDFHHISTIGVVGTAPVDIDLKRPLVFSEYCHDVGQELVNDHEKTKLEAEKKLLSSREKGVNASIYRTGNLMSHSATGKFRENIEEDIFYARMKAFITLGMVPDLKAMSFAVTFIDHLATAIIKLITRKNLKNQTYHLCNTQRQTWPEMAPLLKKAGINIKTVPLEQFLDYLLSWMKQDKYIDAIARLLRHIGTFAERLESWENPTEPGVASDRTERLLKQVGFEWEHVNESHIKKMIHHCKQVGFLN